MKTAALVFAVVLGFAAQASATPITYSLNMSGGGLYGNPVTNVVILETNGSQSSLTFPYTVNATGVTTITHDVAFTPTSSLIIGLETSPGQATHLMFFTDPAWAFAAVGTTFNGLFPSVHHSDFVNRLLAAEGGDQTQQQFLLDFFLTGDGKQAAFATDGPSQAVEFSTAVLPAPEPSTLVLFGLGAAVLASRMRRNR